MRFFCPVRPVLVSVLAVMVAGALSSSPEFYTAAVFEHNRQGDKYKENAPAVIEANLHCYEEASQVAKAEGADIIVFPEYGIFPAFQNRSDVKGYLESIPNPKEVSVTPCDEAETFADRPILYRLSCIAKRNEIVLVANMGGVERCANEPGCPEDGELNLNANVAFDKDGALVGRYYKERLFYELAMDLPREEQDPTFQTDFGKFAMFICFDIMFGKMSATSQLQDIDAVLFSTMWMNSSPFHTATQWWEAWAIGNDATLLAANIQMPGHLSTGSGIFLGRKGSIGHTLNPDGISKLVVSRVPKRNSDVPPTSKVIAIFKNHSHAEWNGDGENVPDVCSYDVLGAAKNVFEDYRCINEPMGNYTLVKLQNPEGHLEACSNNMCCQLDYVASGMDESYYLGVQNGIHNDFYQKRYYWWEESCFLARCDDFNGTACSAFPMTTDTLFREVHMKANFTSEGIYPGFLLDRAKLLPTNDWTFVRQPEESSVAMESSSGIRLLSAGLKGRAYHKDPPYVR